MELDGRSRSDILAALEHWPDVLFVMEVYPTMRKNIAILSILATSLMSYAAVAQDEAAAPPAEGAAPAPEAAPAAAPAPAPEMAPAPAAAAADTKFQVGIAFLPMLIGKQKESGTVSGFKIDQSNDLKFAYGVGITASYVIIPGLSAGIAPQAIFNVIPKNASGDAAKEFDIMARIAYAYPVIPQLSVGVEVLPGYSIISLPSSMSNQGGVKVDNPKGFVIGFGATAAYDINNMFFANLGVGYQMGFQSTSVAGSSVDSKTSFLRILVGGGVKF
jgi:hypothetical protein